MSNTSDIVNSGAIDKLADIIHKLAGPMAEEYGLLLAEKVRVYRLKNWVSVVTKTQKILSDANLPPNAVPPRMFLPILEASSIEDDETLQDLWAGLLATASQQTDSVSPSFVETLKQLTPDEARHLQHVSNAVGAARKFRALANVALNPWAFSERGGATVGVSSDTYERLGLIRRDFDVKLGGRNVWNKRPTTVGEALSAVEPQMRYQFVLTSYATKFIKACNGPRPTVDQGDANTLTAVPIT
jgi:hypothetical protein